MRFDDIASDDSNAYIARLEFEMPTLTIRNIDDGLKLRLRIQAAHNGRSMEEEARQILRGSLDGHAAEKKKNETLADVMYELFGSIGGVDLPERVQEPVRDPPTFD